MHTFGTLAGAGPRAFVVRIGSGRTLQVSTTSLPEKSRECGIRSCRPTKRAGRQRTGLSPRPGYLAHLFERFLANLGCYVSQVNSPEETREICGHLFLSALAIAGSEFAFASASEALA